MKIAVWHNLPSGGGKRALFDHVTGLIERGHHVEVWAPPTIDRGYLPMDALAPEHIVPLDRTHDGTWRERWQLSLQVERQIEAIDEHCARCATEIAAGDFDVLFANSCQFYRTTSIGRFAPIPSVLYLQEPYRWLYEAMPDNPWAAMPRVERFDRQSAKAIFKDWRELRNRRVQVREEIRNARAFDRILCNSYFSRESILRSYGIEAEVCYLGVDTSRFPFHEGRRGPHIVGVGSFTPEKNIELCIRAVAAMPEPRPPLIWIGNVAIESYLQAMHHLARELGVIFDARLACSDDELLAVLGTAMAMIYAPRLEPFGLAPLEAGACGTPVVAVAEGGVRESVKPGVNGLLADPSPSSLAEALIRLRDDPDLARRLGVEGRRHVETNWSREAAITRLVVALERELPSAA